MTLLAIDPGRSYKGEKTIGYALFSERDGEELERGQLTWEELVDELGYDNCGVTGFGYALHTVVIEDFVNNAQSKGGQRNGTSECIGAVEAICWKGKGTFIRQPPAALGPAKLHAPDGSYRKLQHLRHEDSAFLHGYEYLVKMGVIKVDLSGTLEP